MSVDRSVVFAVALIVATLNGLAPRMAQSVDTFGFTGSIANMFGISAIVLFALFAMFAISTAGDERENIGLADVVVVSGVFVATLIPHFIFSSVALFGGALYLWATSRKGSRSSRISTVALALSCTVLWSLVLIRIFGLEVMKLDTLFMATVFGLEQVGNTFRSADGGTRYVVGGSCSSIANISLAVILTATLSQLLEVKVNKTIILAGLAAIGAVVFINSVRLASLGYYPQNFEYLHVGGGRILFGWATMIAVLIIISLGIIRASQTRT